MAGSKGTTICAASDSGGMEIKMNNIQKKLLLISLSIAVTCVCYRPFSVLAATASGVDSTAYGDGSTASALDSTAIGQNATASGISSTALGQDSTASASASTAIGRSAEATATNSVALGTGSIANRANSVSVGSAGNERQITNLADGTADTDAVNLRQLNKVGALSAAIASLSPMDYDPNHKFQVSFGMGEYESQTASALGLSCYFSEKCLFSLGLAGESDKMMGNFSVGYRFGGPQKATNQMEPSEKTITKANIKSQVAWMQDRVAKLKRALDADESNVKEKEKILSDINELQKDLEQLKKRAEQ